MSSFVSTRGAGPVSFTEALVQGLAPDGGLFVPATLEPLSPPPSPGGVLAATSRWAAPSFFGSVPGLDRAIHEALDFEVPLVEIEEGVFLLELFHGPTGAFKDVGARVMARLMARALPSGEPRTVLVATSGDTGSAVASAFQGLAGYRVVALFPAGGISERQRRQMTTLGDNVTAVAVEGRFDDCQRLVKGALADAGLRDEVRLTTANSVNVARLLPQVFYYLYAAVELGWSDAPATFVVPSGNLGNLCAGLLAARAGMPFERFVAATNRNDGFPNYLETGQFTPLPTFATMSTAMDVGDPSNLERIRWLYGDDAEALAADVEGASVSDSETAASIRIVYRRARHFIDPHTAVGYRAFAKRRPRPEGPVVIMATADPAKFADVVEAETRERVPVPAALVRSLTGEERYETIRPDPAALAALLRPRA